MIVITFIFDIDMAPLLILNINSPVRCGRLTDVGKEGNIARLKYPKCFFNA